MAASAVSGTRRAMKELVDGTIRVQVDIDPQCREDFLRLFPHIDTRIALAPLRSEHEQQQQEVGALCKLACIWCKDSDFRQWLYAEHGGGHEFADNEETAAGLLKTLCGVESRKEIDTDHEAKAIFNTIRHEFMSRE